MKIIVFILIFLAGITFSMENYLMKYNARLDRKTAGYIVNQVMENSKKYNFNPYLVFAVMQTESSFNHATVSHAGAKGLMQLMPFNFQEFGVDNSIAGNIKGGVLHLKRDFDRTQNIRDMLICYNAGCGRLKNDAWLKIKETRDYIVKVDKFYKKIMEYKKLNVKDTETAQSKENENIEVEMTVSENKKKWRKGNTISYIKRDISSLKME